ncbi:hypothetical protein MHK_003413 [Candidatus Magnetomorum sp. HK-1]|nr:hypothetical protein MHK_003413 [Candidatus Magnetomorum sp. HK-1]
MNYKFKTLSNLNEIPKLKYQGYIWISDKDKPIIRNNQDFDFSEISENPFIVESYLYARNECISIGIKHIDGQYYISKIDLTGLDLNNIPKSEFTSHSYLCDPSINKKDDESNNKQHEEFKYINFIEFWEKEIDEHCEYLPVLKPAWIAFIGFSKKERV